MEDYFAILCAISNHKNITVYEWFTNLRRSKHKVLRSATNLIKCFQANYRVSSVWKSNFSKTNPVSIIRKLNSAIVRLIARDHSKLRRHENFTPYGKFSLLCYRSLMSSFTKSFYKINIMFVVYWFYYHKTLRKTVISQGAHNGWNMQVENMMQMIST